MTTNREFFNQHKPKSTTGIFNNVLQLVPQGTGDVALDLCCGTGKLTEALSQVGYRAYGVDISDTFIGTDGAAGGDYIIGDINRIPAATSSVQLVSCIDSLQYFHDPGAVIAEIGRVLKPGGRLILSTQNNYNPAGGKKWLVQRITGRNWSPWLAHPVENFVTYPWLINALERQGFQIDYIRGKQFLTAWVSLLPGVVRDWSPWPEQPWRSLASVAGRINLPRGIEESKLAAFAMIVLISAQKRL